MLNNPTSDPRKKRLQGMFPSDFSSPFGLRRLGAQPQAMPAMGTAHEQMAAEAGNNIMMPEMAGMGAALGSLTQLAAGKMSGGEGASGEAAAAVSSVGSAGAESIGQPSSAQADNGLAGLAGSLGLSQEDENNWGPGLGRAFGGMRRFGGYVDPSLQYLVGENGPEMFVPDQPGTVVPMNDPMHPEANASQKYGQQAQSDPPVQTLGQTEAPAQQATQPPSPGSMMPQGATAAPQQGGGVPDSPEYQAWLQQQEAASSGPASPQRPPLTGSRAIGAEIEAMQNAPAQKESSIWKRLGSGIAKGAREWAANGSPGDGAGAIGAMLSGGIATTTSPKLEADWQKERDLKRLWGRHGQAAKGEMDDAKVLQEQSEVVSKQHKARQTAAEPYMNAAMKKGYLTDEEVAHIKEGYGVDITNPDNGTFVEKEVNGKWMIRRSNDPRYTANPTLPAELGEQYYDTEVPGQPGKTLPLKPGQASSQAVGVAQANAGREERRETATIREGEEDADRTAQDKAAFTKRQTDAKAKLAGAKARLAKLDPAIDVKEVAAAEGEAAEAQAILKEKFTGTVSTAKPTTSTFTEADARSHYQRKGKTPEQINSLIQKGKAQGLIK